MTAFSIDVLLPAFSLIADDLDTSLTKVQLMIPFFLAALGVGQLISGSLFDRYGRRSIVIYGLSVYLAGVVVIVLATNIEMVLAGRILQGLGASACTVVARAVIRDLYEGKELARNMALATAVFAFGPIVAPLAGATLLVFFEWRVLMIVMLIFSSTLLLICIFILPETIVQKKSKRYQIINNNHQYWRYICPSPIAVLSASFGYYKCR